MKRVVKITLVIDDETQLIHTDCDNKVLSAVELLGAIEVLRHGIMKQILEKKATNEND